VVDYHGLGRRYLLPHRLLVRPQVNGGTLGGRQLTASSPNELERLKRLARLLVESVLTSATDPMRVELVEAIARATSLRQAH
jgi:hypothetical protein